MTLDILPQTAYIFLMIVARIGTMFMILPAFSEQSISVRIRLILALMVCLIFYPLVSGNYGGIPSNFYALVAAMGMEILIGVFLGLSIRLVMAALQIAATTMAFQLGLSFAMGPDPSTGQQTVQLGRFMGTLAVALIFMTNLHYLMIGAMLDSYKLFPVNQMLPIGDIAEYAIEVVATSFVVALKMSAPFIVYGMIFQFGLGLLSRLMPQLQVYFIAMPANIFIGTILFMILLVTLMNWYMGHIEAVLGNFVAR